LPTILLAADLRRPISRWLMQLANQDSVCMKILSRLLEAPLDTPNNRLPAAAVYPQKSIGRLNFSSRMP
jgi:hypothetical protein